jgi:hypothetical protein
MASNRFNSIIQKLCQGLMRFVLLLFFALLIALIFNRPANAQTFDSLSECEHRAILHTVSYHFDRSQDWNEQNYGVGYRHCIGQGLSLQGGYYHNSYYRDTFYLIVQREWHLAGAIRGGVFAGGVTGYSVPVAAGLMVSANDLTMRFVPPVGSQTSGVIAFELNKAF